MKDLLAAVLILAVGVLVGTVAREAGVPYEGWAGFLVGFAWGLVAVQVTMRRFGRFGFDRWGGDP